MKIVKYLQSFAFTCVSNVLFDPDQPLVYHADISVISGLPCHMRYKKNPHKVYNQTYLYFRSGQDNISSCGGQALWLSTSWD